MDSAWNRPTKTTPPYAPQSSRFGSEPPSVEDDVNIVYAILELHARNDEDDGDGQKQKNNINKTSASVELTQTRHLHSKQLFHGGQISVFLQGGSKSFIRCL